MSEKVKLPRDVIDAIESLRGKGNIENDALLLCVLCPKGNDGFTIAQKLKDGVIDIDTLLNALVNGYEVIQTPENKVSEQYQIWDKKAFNPEGSCNESLSKMHGMIRTLDLLNIKIEGVNT